MEKTDVLIAGAGPCGLMLAGELALAGLRPLVLEKRPVSAAIERGSGFAGQALTLLRYRGLFERLAGASLSPEVAARFPFASLHIDLTDLPDNPMQAIPLPQPVMVGLLAERAAGLGAAIRYRHEVTGATQDTGAVTVDVTGPDGPYQVTARYLVGCDGGRSVARAAAGIAFPGTSYPQVNRMASVAIPESVTPLADGGFDVPGVGVVPFGFQHTDGGLFAISPSPNRPGNMGVYTEEDDPAAADSDEPMTVAEMAASVRRVLGADVPMGEPTRLTRFSFQARQAERYRDGRILLAGDAAHLFPAGGQGIGIGVLDAVNLAWKLAAAVGGWAPPGLLDTYHDERHPAGARALMQTRAQVALRRGNDAEAEALRALFGELLADEQPQRRLAALLAGADNRYPVPGQAPHPLAGTFAPDLTLRITQHSTTQHSTTHDSTTHDSTSSIAELMRPARPVLLDLADRKDLREAALDWRGRVDVVTATTRQRPADALLIRPDAYIAWATAARDTATRAPGTGEPAGPDAGSLRDALAHWFGPAA